MVDSDDVRAAQRTIYELVRALEAKIRERDEEIYNLRARIVELEGKKE